MQGKRDLDIVGVIQGRGKALDELGDINAGKAGLEHGIQGLKGSLTLSQEPIRQSHHSRGQREIRRKYQFNTSVDKVLEWTNLDLLNELLLDCRLVVDRREVLREKLAHNGGLKVSGEVQREQHCLADSDLTILRESKVRTSFREDLSDGTRAWLRGDLG